MRFCYAHRRFTAYPSSLDTWDLVPGAYFEGFAARAARLGFDGVEVGAEVMERAGDTEAPVREFARRMAGEGLPVVSVRAGGSLIDPRSGPAARERVLTAVRNAAWAGAEVVNGACSTPARYPSGKSYSPGWPRSQDASRDASMYEYEAMAAAYQKLCDRAADSGLTISVEVHQNSPIDNSWSSLLLCGLVERPNFGINPDLGNIYWTYDVPEESAEEAITALAPVAVYWHCKNLMRVHHPENERSIFLRVPLPDGQLDYRFAIEAMHAAGYGGFMAIEGAQLGDQWHADGESLAYAKAIWAELERAE